LQVNYKLKGMHMSLFPVKVRALFKSMADADVLDQLVEAAKGMPVNSPEDSNKRIALTTPGVRYAAEMEVGLDVRKVRLSIQRGVNRLYLADSIKVELYDEDDNPLCLPYPLSQVEAHLSSAIEAELYNVLLRAKGIDIPMHE
jgi:hypothetical protein